jgi:hypothetical protein
VPLGPHQEVDHVGGVLVLEPRVVVDLNTPHTRPPARQPSVSQSVTRQWRSVLEYCGVVTGWSLQNWSKQKPAGGP